MMIKVMIYMCMVSNGEECLEGKWKKAMLNSTKVEQVYQGDKNCLVDMSSGAVLLVKGECNIFDL